MKRLLNLTWIAIFVFGAIAPVIHADESIGLGQVPKEVMEAVKSKFKDFKPESAEKEKGWRSVEYEIEGTAAGKKWAVFVTVDKKGEITEVEVEEED